VKEVDPEELTIRFYQEVYDGNGTLREVHHKYRSISVINR
jgi:hypothetical protein